MPISRVMIIIILLHTAIVGKCILPGDHWHNGTWETELCQGVYYEMECSQGVGDNMEDLTYSYSR